MTPVQGQGNVSPQEAVKPTTPPPDYRAGVVKWALWGVQNEPQIHYLQHRPMPLTAALPMNTDCSGFATLCYKLAGAPDPNGRGYDGQGYTGTLESHARAVHKEVSIQNARPADLMQYGSPPGHHVCIVVGTVKDAHGKVTDLELVSHGQEKGPQKILHSIEQQYQPTPATVFSYLP